MSQHTKVSDAFKMPVYANLFYDVRAPNQAPDALSLQPEKAVGVNKKSFQSMGLMQNMKSSIENNIEKHGGSRRVDNTNVEAMERKLKRKSFFEHICGNKTQKTELGTADTKKQVDIDRVSPTMTRLAHASQPRAEGSKRGALGMYIDGVYGSTSTVDSSDLSIDPTVEQQSKAAKSGFVRLHIKKTKLAPSTNKKLEFVCLTDHLKNKRSDCATKKRFPKVYEGNNIFSFDSDLCAWDGKCVDLDEKTLVEVLSKGKY